MEEQATSSQVPPAPAAPSMPNFEAMRQLAMQQAIQQMAERPPAPPAPQPQPSYIPQQPVAQPQPPAPAPQIQTTRQKLTRAELLAVFVIACIAVTGVQAVWNFTTNILPRIEIRAN